MAAFLKPSPQSVSLSCNNLYLFGQMLVFPEILPSHDTDLSSFVKPLLVTRKHKTTENVQYGILLVDDNLFSDVFPRLIVSPQYTSPAAHSPAHLCRALEIDNVTPSRESGSEGGREFITPPHSARHTWNGKT